MNTFLSKLGIILRERRPLTPTDLEYTILSKEGQRHLYAYICFRTRGCRFDHLGQCVMCDYWRSAPIDPEAMKTACRNALDALIEVPEVLQVTPSGSMFDEWEVPGDVRRELFSMVAEIGCEKYICETRPEFVTPQVLREMRSIMPGKELGIEIGLESSDPWVLEYVLGKSSIPLARLNEGLRTGTPTSDSERGGQFNKIPSYYGRAVKDAHMESIEVFTNILLGAPFLSVSEAVEDTIRSVRWAFEKGADYCIVFPLHVKPWTIVHRLWEMGHYASPSLWSLVEVLWRLGCETADRTFISWYQPQYTAKHREMGKRSDDWPHTCSRCEGEVLSLLDEYRGHGGFEIIERLYWFPCPCKDEWRRSMAVPPAASVAERIRSGYAVLGPAVQSPGEYGDRLTSTVERMFREAPAWALNGHKGG